ncbi:MAG: GDP-mannose 4,6 dehydratase [Rickettsiales bacterium]|nr:GDP-mannose 4,6 dehydratase [Rickettsiales bacterium]|tara:strand:- start:227 stop:1114 length:888 start_codon:yes stop_codon:yes gene_type:complete
MSQRVLVTGSEGFTGRYVCNEFAGAGWEVWGAGVQPKPDNPRYLNINLLKPETLGLIGERAQPHVVVHLAASAFVAEADPTVFYGVNLLGTRHLLEELSTATTPPSCTILASSANVYGNSTLELLDESAATHPTNDYAVSKLAMEYLAKTYMARLGIVITRPFNYTGVGQEPRYLIPKIVSHFKRQLPYIELGNTDVAREFSDVRDIARTYRSLAEALPCGETFNLCCGEATALETVIRMASEITKHDIEVKVNPEFVREKEIKVLRGSREKLDSVIGYERRYKIRETLEWMLQN